MPVTRGDSISFDDALANYGDDSRRIQDEVRRDLKRAIETAIGSVAFNRAEGFGIAGLENDNLVEGKKEFIKFFIANAIANYNESAPLDKQVISSQEVIDIQTNSDGEAEIKIYYLLATSAFNNQATPDALSFNSGL